MHRERRWDEYITRRETHKRNGVPAGTAWRLAALEMPPLDGSKPEFEPTDEMAELLAQAGGQVPEPEVKKIVQWKDYTAKVSEAIVEGVHSWDNLRNGVDKSRKGSEVDIIQWCFQHAGTPVSDIEPSSVPNQGAVRLLQWMKSSPGNYGEFIRNIWSKTIPDRKTLEWQSKFTDDGRQQFSLLDELEKSIAEPGTES